MTSNNDDTTKRTIMTGPEHYLEAEWLIELATAEGYKGHRIPAPQSASVLALAQVHATLALAAATATAPTYADITDFGERGREARRSLSEWAEVWAEVTS